MPKKTESQAEPQFPYTKRLLQAVMKDELIVGKRTTGDWLALLSKAELTELNAMVEGFNTQDSNQKADIVNLVIHLVMLEIDDNSVEMNVDDVAEYLEGLRVLCHLEVLSRQGLLEVSGDKRLAGNPHEKNIKMKLTADGMKAVQHPNADPVLQAVLKARGNPLWN